MDGCYLTTSRVFPPFCRHISTHNRPLFRDYYIPHHCNAAVPLKCRMKPAPARNAHSLHYDTALLFLLQIFQDSLRFFLPRPLWDYFSFLEQLGILWHVWNLFISINFFEILQNSSRFFKTFSVSSSILLRNIFFSLHKAFITIQYADYFQILLNSLRFIEIFTQLFVILDSLKR